MKKKTKKRPSAKKAAPDVRRRQAWKRAEWDYAELHATLAFPVFGRPSPQQIMERLEGMLRKCPEFYPAQIELGIHALVDGAGSAADAHVEAGVRTMLALATPEHLARGLESLIDNLEKIWRFDLARRLLLTLVERFPHEAAYHDSLGHAAARLGTFPEALAHAGEAVRLAPANAHYRSNLGWVHLAAGKRDEAREALDEAARLKPGGEVIEGNQVVLEWLQARGGGTYLDYLLRPAPREELRKAAEAEDWEQADALRSDCDACRLEAVAQTLLAEGGEAASRLPSTVAALEQFFRFVRQVSQDEEWFAEDADYLCENLEPILHKFIFKFGDVDRPMLEEIFASLLSYYGILAQHGVVAEASRRAFEETVGRVQPELIRKMERFNAVRHDPSVPEETKEDLREELFEGDHLWPHL